MKIGKWIKGFFENPVPPVPETFGTFTEQAAWRFGKPIAGGYADEKVMDPFEVDRRMKKHGDGEQWTEAIAILRSAKVAEKIQDEKIREIVQAKKREAFEGLVALSRQVFELRTIEEAGEKDGWTDAQAFLLMTDYLAAVQLLENEFLPLPKLLARPAA